MPKISKSQLTQRKQWFSNWIPDVETKVTNWILSLSNEDQEGLDFSIESLNSIEALMLAHFPTNESAFSNLANSSILDIYGSYIGETLKRNHCIELIWDCDFSNAGYETWVNFHPYLTSNYTNCSQIINMQYVLHQRTGDKLIKQYLQKEELFLKAKNEDDLGQNNSIIIDKGYSYQHFILCQDNNYTIDQLQNEIKTYNKIKNRNYPVEIKKNILILKLKEDYNFNFQIDNSEGVEEESKEISESYKGKIDKNLISNCKTRIEFWGDEDDSGNYMNESFFVLEHFAKNEEVLIYNFKNGEFIEHD